MLRRRLDPSPAPQPSQRARVDPPPVDPAPEPARSRGRRVALVLLAWSLFSVANATQVYLSMLDHGHSYPRMVVYNLALWSVWAMLAPAVRALALRVPLLPPSARALAVHLVAALAAATLHVAAWTELIQLLRPYDAMTTGDFARNFGPSLGLKLQLELLIYAVIAGLATAVESARRLHRRELDAERLAAQLAGAQLRALELQLRPHFLFNTLHAVAGLVREARSTEAVETIVRLSDLLHQSLATEQTPQIPLERELELLSSYLEIERVRFSDRLTLTFEVEPQAGRALIPPFLLQPLAENAVRHGVAKLAGAVELRLAARRRGERLEIDLFNSGPPLRGAGTGVGLANCRARLRQLYGDRAELALADAPGGVVARLRLPFTAVDGAEAVT